jgi:hypothetical protein
MRLVRFLQSTDERRRIGAQQDFVFPPAEIYCRRTIGRRSF